MDKVSRKEKNSSRRKQKKVRGEKPDQFLTEYINRKGKGRKPVY
jgi:hypothetical protein